MLRSSRCAHRERAGETPAKQVDRRFREPPCAPFIPRVPADWARCSARRRWRESGGRDMSTTKVNVLIASNVVLVVALVWRDQLTRWARRLCKSWMGGRVSPPQSPSRLRSSEAGLRSYLGQDYQPPLPKPVADALERSCLCFLATAGKLEPHLSLMRFTYTASLEENNSEVMIISTRRDTKKYDIITENNNVALLVHDFDASSGSDESNYSSVAGQTRYSITLNGTVKVQEGELAERYRQIHLSANPAYSQFIVGDEIAIITVNLERARVCDVNDRVSHFARDGTAASWKELPSLPERSK